MSKCTCPAAHPYLSVPLDEMTEMAECPLHGEKPEPLQPVEDCPELQSGLQNRCDQRNQPDVREDVVQACPTCKGRGYEIIAANYPLPEPDELERRLEARIASMVRYDKNRIMLEDALSEIRRLRQELEEHRVQWFEDVALALRYRQALEQIVGPCQGSKAKDRGFDCDCDPCVATKALKEMEE